MTPATLVRATQGLAIPGLTILEKIDDPLRLCTIYADQVGNLVVGFGGTRPSLLDWLLNIQPDLEAGSLMPRIDHWFRIYAPASMTLLGHSQGGSHAESIAEWVGSSWPVKIDVVTFGGLPRGHDGTHYLNRRDPMAWVPWGLLGLTHRGKVVKIGPKGWPSLKAHDPGAYIKELERIKEKGGPTWP